MQFKIDENLPVEAAELLRQAGHDATTVVEQELGGGTDVEIAAVCQREGRALLTLDLDFADIRAYPPKQYPGLLVLRLQRQDKLLVLDTLQNLVSALHIHPLSRHLWIVEENRIRIRD